MDVAGRRLTAHGDPGPDGYRRRDDVAPPGPVTPTALPDVAVDLMGLFG